MIDVTYLIQKITDAGLPILTLRDTGTFEMQPGATPQQTAAVQAIIDTYDPAAAQARADEIQQAGVTARQWFLAHQAAIDFIRLTPAQQEAQIDGMTTAQLKTLLKYLTIAVAVLVKRELL